MTSSLRRELASLVSGEGVLPEGVPWRWPGGVDPPAVQVAPGSQEEVAAVLERASLEGWSVLPSGSGSRLGGVGGRTADILLSTRRLGEMIFYEPADLTFTAGSGLPFRELQERTGRHGQWVPLDPGGWDGRTFGGVVATGSAGPLRYAYGSPRDHVLGLTVVTGDGRILRWGGQVVKNVAGFDVTRLCIGSRGALGVITSVSARLFPLPEEERTLLLFGPSMEELLPLAQRFYASPLPFSTLEVMEPLGGAGTGTGSGGGVAMRMLGTRPQVEEMERRGRELAADWLGEGRGMEVLGGEESGGLFRWISSWDENADLVLRLSLLPSRVDTLVVRSRALQRELHRLVGGEARMALHMGWGVLRLAISASGPWEEELEGAVKILSELRGELEGEGGSLVLSRGPAGLVRELGVCGTMGGEMEIMTGLKREFDPHGILPGSGWRG